MGERTNANEYGSIQKEQEETGERETGFTRTQQIILLSFVLVNLANCLTMSIMAPFFAVSASKKGTSDTGIGLIFGIHPLVKFLSSPILGIFLSRIGTKPMYLAGLFTFGSCDIIFGFLDRISDTSLFIALCFVVKSIEAVGTAAIETAGFAMIAWTFPSNLGTMNGIINAVYGLGYMIGPPLAGYIYSVGGYTLPFALLGGFTLLLALCNMFILPPQTDGGQPMSESLLQFLRIPSTIVTCGSLLIVGMSQPFLLPTFAKHIQTRYNLDATAAGLLFLVPGGTFTIFSFFWGWITDKKNIPKLLMIIGNIGATAAFLYLGPSPLLKTEYSDVWMVIPALVLFGSFIACSLVPPFYDMFTTAKWFGMPDNFGTYGVVSGLFNSSVSLGSFVGPTAGAALVQAYGFGWACTVIAAINLLAALVLILFCLWEYQCGKGRRLSPYHEEQMAVNGNYGLDYLKTATQTN